MFTIRVDRNGVVLDRHFDTRDAASAAGRGEGRKGHTVLAIFFPGERRV